MGFSRRQFIGISALAALSGCARVKQSRIGQLAPDFQFGGDGVVKFATLGDLHIVDSRGAGIVGRAVNAINNDKDIDFVVVLGDLTEHGTLPQMNIASGALGRLERPYFCVPGEHDLNDSIEDPYEFYRRSFKKTQWRTNNEGWIFLGLDTCNGAASQPEAPAEHLEWLRNQLSHTEKKKPIALLAHHPFNPNAKADRVANADEVLALFAEHNLRLVASGHYHGNQVEERDGVLFTTTACCSSAAGNDDGTKEKGYRVYTLDGELIQHEFVAVT